MGFVISWNLDICTYPTLHSYSTWIQIYVKYVVWRMNWCLGIVLEKIYMPSSLTALSHQHAHICCRGVFFSVVSNINLNSPVAGSVSKIITLNLPRPANNLKINHNTIKKLNKKDNGSAGNWTQITHPLLHLAGHYIAGVIPLDHCAFLRYW